MKFHKDMTLPEDPEAILIFGSNTAGRHGAGAAKLAHDQFGAEYGVGVGRTGMSYALPTCAADISSLPLEVIANHVNNLIDYIVRNPALSFFMTRAGCVRAFHTDEEMAGLFVGCEILPNVDWPEEWEPFFNVDQQS